MKKLILTALLLVGLALLWILPEEPLFGLLASGPKFQGRAATYWAKQITLEDPALRESARIELAEGGSQAVPVLVKLLQHEGPDWAAAEVRWRSAEILGQIGPNATDATNAMLTALQDGDSHVRSVAASVLPAIGASAEQAVPALIDFLQDEPSVPASRALSEYGPDAAPAMDVLSNILRNASLDSETRWNAARTLGKLRAAGAPAIPILMEHLDDKSDTVREHCAEALGDIGPVASSAVDALIAVLDDSYVKVRRDAVRSLGQIGSASKPALPVIKKLAEDDPEQLVRDAAKTALEAIQQQADAGK